MTENDIVLERLAVEKKRVELDLRKMELEVEKSARESAREGREVEKELRESRFLFRNSAALIAASISILSFMLAFMGAFQAKMESERTEIERNRRWFSDAASFITDNKAILFSKDSVEKDKIMSIMQVIYPPEIVKTITEKFKAASDDPRVKNFWEGQFFDIEIKNETTKSSAAVTIPTSGDFRTILNSDNRRTASDLIAKKYASNQDGIMQQIVETVVPETEKSSYRVNLYVLVILSKIVGGWQATPSQASLVEKLYESAYMGDPTYKKLAERARNNKK
jgi:hypothetical protein